MESGSGGGVGFVPQFHQDHMGWRWGSSKKGGLLPPKLGGRNAEYTRTSLPPQIHNASSNSIATITYRRLT